MSNKIGIIAEDESDVKVIYNILSIYCSENSFKIRKKVGKGCSRIKSKCYKWATLLTELGCKHILLFHDLDEDDLEKLKCNLEKKVDIKNNKHVLVVIPVKEIEAWLLSDMLAIKNTFSLMKLPKSISDTERIDRPKEFLRDIVNKYSKGKITYLNTIHNEKISLKISKTSLRKCPSFIPLEKYINNNLK